MTKKLILLSSILLIFACNGSKKNETIKESAAQVTDGQNTTVVNSIGELLNEESQVLVEDWREYQILNEELENYYSITAEEALFKAKDISIYAQELRDSIRLDFLDRPDVKIRLNVFYNTALRLSDMSTIRTISSDEVKAEVTNLLEAFSAINGKINNIVIQQNLERELRDFEK